MTTLTLTERDVSREYDIPVRTLQGWRNRGGGPEFLKCGRSVRYRRDSIEKWLTDCTRRSTSDTSADQQAVPMKRNRQRSACEAERLDTAMRFAQGRQRENSKTVHAQYDASCLAFELAIRYLTEARKLIQGGQP